MFSSQILKRSAPLFSRSYSTALKKAVIIQAIGRDSIGLVATASKTITDEGGFIKESRMMKIDGNFSLMVAASIDADKDQKIQSALSRNMGPNMKVTVRELTPATVDLGERTTRKIEIVGVDGPGLLAGVTAMLAEHDINIESLDTFNTAAPFSGDPMFHIHVAAGVPIGMSDETVVKAIEKFGAGKLKTDMWVETIRESSHQQS